MEVINLSSRSFKGLKTLELPNTVYNTEGKIYIYEDKDKWNKRMHLVKRLYINSGPIFSNKLATINSLVDYQDDIDMPELVYPEKLLTIDREIVGFTMPYVPSTNLKEILTSSKTPAEVKIKYLKDIGTILEKMEEVRKYADLEDFYLNDLHEGNFIVDREGTLRVIDLDSCKIAGNMPFCSKYLSRMNPSISNLPGKYRLSNSRCSGDIIPNKDSDLYCYIITVLNTIFGRETHRLPLEIFYDYLDYLRKIGVSTELIDIISDIYSNKSNTNPKELLDGLEPVFYKCHESVFKSLTKQRRCQ